MQRIRPSKYFAANENKTFFCALAQPNEWNSVTAAEQGDQFGQLFPFGQYC